eukprot:TRINITY_DN69621_c0_g1_i1.p1 TRINITY_DN69621_c0_g1~~TRINITY_DN69621_c0_g1_i1.p1  ORF type:complete len:905 (-),score=211.49 TRINITY_DN69621_c0_g1_i1:293-3007(-)
MNRGSAAVVATLQRYGFLLAAAAVASSVFTWWTQPDVFLYAGPVFFITFGALFFAIWICYWLLSQDDGDESMHQTSEPIRIGAEAFLRVQYGAIARIAIIAAIVIFVLFLFRDPSVSTGGGHDSVAHDSDNSMPNAGGQADAHTGRARVRELSQMPQLVFGDDIDDDADDLVFDQRSGSKPSGQQRVAAAPRVSGISSTQLATATAFAFCLGAMFSGIAGYVSMWVSVRANVRVASAAARMDYPAAVAISIRGGAFCGLLVVALCVLGLTSLFVLFAAFFPSGASNGGGILGDAFRAARVPHLLVGYGFGASLVALFAQLGGGIYTKAADVGADMVGKVEASIPEDDPRNPAVIADLVGDNVGDCAGRGADLFESIGGEMIGAMILGSEMAADGGLSSPLPFIFFPLVLHSFDLLISSVAVMACTPRRKDTVRTSTPLSPTSPMRDRVSPMMEQGLSGGPGSAAMSTRSAVEAMETFEDALTTLSRGYLIALGLSSVVLLGLCRWLLYVPSVPEAWMYFYGCGLIGCLTSLVFVQVTKYYTDYTYSPVLRIAAASKTGSGTNVIMGVAVGLESTAIPAVMISCALVGSFQLGERSGILTAAGEPTGGLFGTAVATMGMLSTAVYVLAMDTFGPITDNAGGIVEMADLPEGVRAITDRLDAVGNVTKATTKGYSIGAAGLASFLLFRAFLDVVNEMAPPSVQVRTIDIGVPEVFVGGFLGAALVFLFAAWAIAAVGKSAEMVVHEVRLQFTQRPGILLGRERPDYDKCVAIVTHSALREMIRPGLLAVISPLAVGLGARVVGSYTGRVTLGAESVAAFMLFATATGVLLALFLNNAGGAWDNAKKYIETGAAYGGKGSEAHKAAITGDTVGDPFKDTAGPSIHVLIKLLATITLVACPLLIPSGS